MNIACMYFKASRIIYLPISTKIITFPKLFQNWCWGWCLRLCGTVSWYPNISMVMVYPSYKLAHTENWESMHINFLYYNRNVFINSHYTMNYSCLFISIDLIVCLYHPLISWTYSMFLSIDLILYGLFHLMKSIIGHY